MASKAWNVSQQSKAQQHCDQGSACCILLPWSLRNGAVLLHLYSWRFVEMQAAGGCTLTMMWCGASCYCTHFSVRMSCVFIRDPSCNTLPRKAGRHFVHLTVATICFHCGGEAVAPWAVLHLIALGQACSCSGCRPSCLQCFCKCVISV